MKKYILTSMDEFKEAEKYWLEKLSGELTEVKLRGDFSRTKGYSEERYQAALGKEETSKLLEISKNNDLSLYILLLVTLKILLYKYLGQEDIIVASPVYTPTNRKYNKYVVFRDTVHPGMTFKDLLLLVKDTVLDGYKNEHFSTRDLLTQLELQEGISLARVVLLLENIHPGELIDEIRSENEIDIALCFRKNDGLLEFEIIYNSGVFARESIRRIMQGYQRILNQALNDTSLEISTVELLTKEEKNKILSHFNHTKIDYPGNKTVHELFTEQVEKTPHQVAVSSITDLMAIYEELKNKTLNPHLFKKLEKCYFKRNPFVFSFDVETDSDSKPLKLLKTHRHTSMIVNNNVVELLKAFDGERSITGIFSQLKEMNLVFYVYPIKIDDLLEISCTFTPQVEKFSGQDFKEFLGLIKMLYTNYLIDLEGLYFSHTPGKPLHSDFDENESFDEAFILDDLFNRSDRVSPAEVLLIGDTPGMPTVGLLYMASYLWRNGIKARCHFHDLNGDYASLKKNIESLLDRIQPRWVGVSMKWFPYMARVLETCKIVKAHSPGIKIILGANTASYYTEKVIEYDFVDYVVRGDGEVPLLKICQGADYLPNCVYKKDGKIIENPITYVHNETNSKDIYLSHLDKILISRYASLFGTFFIPTQKGCTLNCCYCGGCRGAQEKAFGRKGIFKRGIEEVRKDIIEAKKYASLFMFDLIESNEYYVDYYKKITAGIDLSNYFCVYGNYIAPSAEVIDVMCRTFNYVYWELDMASLSERHRDQLVSLNLVKIQPSDKEILEFYNACEKYDNNEVRMNLIAGLPYFNHEDIEASDNMLKHILKFYTCLSDFHWGRLHAQPGAPITYEAGKHQMYSYATTYEDFLKYSKMNFDPESPFPGIVDYKYPYVYFLDQELNSAVSRHSVETRSVITEYKEKRREKAISKRQLTYRELNQWARELASLLKKKGIETDGLVSLLMESSLEMVVSILAVLKAGAAFLPLDPAYPPQRKKYILKDSGVNIVLTQGHLLEENKEIMESLALKHVIPVDDIPGEPGKTPDLDNSSDNDPHHLAYVIYTSGTTGSPKGVPVEHKGLVNYTGWRIQSYGLTANDVALQPLSYCFDGFGSNFYPTLLSGGTLVMIPDSKKMEYDYIKEVVKQEKVTNISLVPLMYDAILSQSEAEDLARLRFVVLGGEKASPSLVERSQKQYPGIRHIIEYGPTETSVGAAAHVGISSEETAVIGRPIANTRVYILDGYHQLQPIGVTGELFINGPGLARGYLNNPELTGEKFRRAVISHSSLDIGSSLKTNDRSSKLSTNIQCPMTNDRFYKTGDLARWLKDGKIELLGRIDHQVKIRGFRIELAEIENRLSRHPQVKEAVVIARGNSKGEQSLCAYFVAHPGTFAIDSAADELREYLAGELPAYMIPSYFIPLKKIPLNLHGKVDGKALPEPGIRLGLGDDDTPGNEIERKLAEIWSEVLGNPVGINENFFKAGGDSIKAIQISARLKSHHWELKVNDIFSNPTIKQVARCVKQALGDISQPPDGQDLVRGPVPLTPVQRWFFENFPANRHHFNQAVMLYNEKGFDEKGVKNVFSKIVEHHDALRMIYKIEIEGQEIHQENRGLEGQLFDLVVKDLRDSGDNEGKIIKEANRLQEDIDLNSGPLLKLGLFKTQKGDHLLIVIHHLVVDGISWRILLEDFATAYTQASKGEQIRLPGKTHSFKNWAHRLQEYAKSPEVLNQLEYWQAFDRVEVKPLPKDNQVEADKLVMENIETRVLSLTAPETTMLLTEVHHAYNTEINDILLAALGMALNRWMGIDRAAINLEGHGREEIIPGMDIRRTVGWFTSQFPVILDMTEPHDLSHRVKAVKETLRQIPHKGIGYDILRYLTPAEDKEGIRFELQPEISFNYLGQFRQEIQHPHFDISPMHLGNSVSLRSPQQHVIAINGMVTADRLELAFSYNKFQYRKAAIEKLMDCYRSDLLDIIHHCRGKRERELTPSDLTYPGLSIRQLEELQERIGRENTLQDIYPLSPMQQGMYFYALKEEGSYAYFEQNVISLEGKIDLQLLEESMNRLVERYDVLRTLFVHEFRAESLQIVLTRRPLKIRFEDLSSLSEGERENYFDAFKHKDKEQGFNLSKDLLIRLSIFLFNKEPAEYKLVLSFHHILMDGWCMAILLKDLRHIYRDLKQGQSSPGGLPPVTPYKKYIQWLAARDSKECLGYWRDYLEGYEQEILLPGALPGKPETRETVQVAYYHRDLQPPVSRDLEQVAAANQVTVNTLFQVFWGILLQRYNHSDDVVFGAVVSGRPGDIENVENMVGLFINTIPVRIRTGEIKTISGLMREVQRQSLESAAHEYLPLAEIQSVSPLKNQLIQHLLIFENYRMDESLLNAFPGEAADSPDFAIVGLEVRDEGNYDFNLVVMPGEKYRLLFNYNACVFAEEYIERTARHIEEVVKQVSRHPGMEIREIEIITLGEKQAILAALNNTSVDYPKDKTLTRLFAEQVEKTPDKIAVAGLETETGTGFIASLSYVELNKKAEQVARLLRAKGVKPDTIAAIIVERSPGMIYGILGILKSGAAYLPIDPDYPPNRIKYMLEDSQALVLLTETGVIKDNQWFAALRKRQGPGLRPYLTLPRPSITELDRLPLPDRSLVDYEQYNRYIGQAMVKTGISLQGTRGCPYQCAYCHKIWPKKHIVRSAENIFEEVRMHYNLGIRRFVIIDDIFNLDNANSTRFFRLITRNGMKPQIFFPSGVRGDILTREYIDLMVEAGTTGLALALETASPRLQKLISKNLDLDKLRENIEYFLKEHPQVILELFTMHGFPTETEAEARSTLDFIKSLKWLHFPYVFILKIFPNTDMEKLAIKNGISKEAIVASDNLAFHELPETLPFDKGFTLKYQADFLNHYFLSKERLLHVLPYQLKVFTPDEIVQKYNSYLPVDIKTIDDLLEFTGITREELKVKDYLEEDFFSIPGFNQKLKDLFGNRDTGKHSSAEGLPKASRGKAPALRILLLDLSQYFSQGSKMLYDVVEPPLGLMYILTYLKEQLGEKVNGKIAKSRIDFDNYTELKRLLDEFRPDVIGIRTLSFYKDFFHRTLAMIRHWDWTGPVIVGGPYATSDYATVLQDANVDLVVRGEGEHTFAHLIREIMANEGQLPREAVLKEIPGIAYIPAEERQANPLAGNREIIFLDALSFSEQDKDMSPGLQPARLKPAKGVGQSPGDLAYIIYTSGTTGIPKGSLIQHGNVVRLMFNHQFQFDFNSSDTWTLFHSYCFDFSVWEMYGALLYGGKLLIIPKMVTRDTPRYLEILKKEHVTILNQTPAAFYNLAHHELERPGKKLTLKYVIFGGEALHPIQLKEWKEKYPHTKLINMFGITETTVHVTYKEIEPKDIQSGISSIGQPIPTLSTYVTDKNLKLIPIGAVGEICVGGQGVCRGYLNHPGLTRERFVKDPYLEDGRLYRSGDLGKLSDNGDIEYLGRIDHQVKIRGYRVELGEIEHQLLQNPLVKEAVVASTQHKTDTGALAAYVVPDPKYARPILQLLNLERKGALVNKTRHEYPNGMMIFYMNRNETDFMYREIIEDQSYLKHGITLEDGACIFDVGANIGIFSLFVNQLCKRAKIYAFEPIPQVFELLSLNTSIYCQDIETFACGIGEKEIETTFIYYPHATVLSGRFADKTQEKKTVKSFIRNEQLAGPEENRLADGEINELLETRLVGTPVKCKMKRLSQVIREKGVDKIDILKIDVEKGEIDVLNGIEEGDWKKIRQLVIEVHNIDGRLDKIRQRLGKLGYRVTAEQDSELINTDLYNVYAIRSNEKEQVITETRVNANPEWINPGRFIDDLRNSMQRKLPEYMVPTYFVLLYQMPLTPHGKIDRNALPDPGIEIGKVGIGAYTPPGNKIEEKLVAIWSEVLKIDKNIIGIDADFFHLGGHSLKSTIMVSKIQKWLNVKIPLSEIFQRPTIRKLSQYINETVKEQYTMIERVEEKEYYKLSSVQKRLYYVQQLDKKGTAYHITMAWILEGVIEKDRLEKSIRKLIRRHESLRTGFQSINGELFQRIEKEVDFNMEYHEIPGDNIRQSQVIKNFVRPFDLAKAPLMRIGLIHTPANYILLLDMHHIVTDGASMAILVRDFMTIYEGKEPPALGIQYKDFCQWQNKRLSSEELRNQQEYWQKEFAGNIPTLDLPMDYPRPAMQSFAGSRINFILEKKETSALNEIARENQATLFMVLLALYNILLSKLSGEEDIIVGTPIAGRRHEDLNQVVGMLVNTLALRNYPTLEKTFTDFLKEVKEKTLQAFENQDYLFENLVELIDAAGDLSRHPVFTVVFAMQNLDIPEIEIPDLKLKPIEEEGDISKFDLTMNVFENENGGKMHISFEYCSALFTRSTIEKFGNYFREIIEQTINDRLIKLEDIKISHDVFVQKLVVPQDDDENFGF